MDKDFLIIDSHVHTYPSVEVGRQSLGAGDGTLGYGYCGTIKELEEAMLKTNISHSVMANFLPLQEMKKANIARLPAGLSSDQEKSAIQEIDKKMIERMKRKNRWTCESAMENQKLTALISVDVVQSPEEMVEELESNVTTLGAKGMKLHPIANEYYPWDKRMLPVYSKAQELDVPILFHAGLGEIPVWDNKYGNPSQFEKVAKTFPSLTIILAHLGKGFYEESVEVAKKCSNIYFDTSTCFFNAKSSSAKDNSEKILNIIKKIGTNRIMFGTDWPWFDPQKDIEIIKNLDLSYEEKAKILGLNAKEVYKL